MKRDGATASSLFTSNVMVSASGTIAGSGGAYIFRGNLNNQSTANTTLLGNAEIHQLNSLTESVTVIPNPTSC